MPVQKEWNFLDGDNTGVILEDDYDMNSGFLKAGSSLYSLDSGRVIYIGFQP